VFVEYPFSKEDPLVYNLFRGSPLRALSVAV